MSINQYQQYDQQDLYQSSIFPTKLQQQKYKKLKVLGQGSMGKVYLVSCPAQNDKLYVMKRINIGHLQSKQKQQALLEADLHKMVKHQNIIQFKEIYHTTKQKLCIIMQYAQNGDLQGIIKQCKDNKKTLTEEQIIKYFLQMCKGLKQIHDKKIVHRDLKGANIFLDKLGNIKIGDFGISKVMDKTVLASKSFAGTPYYLSPQMVQGKPYSTKADVWALGVIVYHLTALKLPFDANSLPVLALKILKGAFPPIPGNNYSKQLKNAISSMLIVDQRKRPSINQLLNKPIFSKYLTKQFIATISPKIKPKVQIKSQKIKIATMNSKKQIKAQKSQKLSEQQKKKKRQQQKIKRQEQRRKMMQDIKIKRIQSSKQQGNQGMSKVLENQNQTTVLALQAKTQDKGYLTLPKPEKSKCIQKVKSSKQIPIKQEQYHSNKESNINSKIEKPWKNKNNLKKGKQVQVQIHLPGQRKVSKPQIIQQKTLPKGKNFQVKIFVQGENPYRKNQNKEQISNGSKKQISVPLTKKTTSQEQIQQIIQRPHKKDYASSNFQDLLANVQQANDLVNKLNNNNNILYKKYQNIELYEQSQDFDNLHSKIGQVSQNNGSNKKLITNQNDQQNMKFITNITNTENLQQLRQILQDRLGQQGFIKAHQIIKQHFQKSNQNAENQEPSDPEQQAYLFNRKILRQKLNFLTNQQFDRNVQLLYTISIMQDMQMMKNFQDQEQDENSQDCDGYYENQNDLQDSQQGKENKYR